jgi:hypothetical protein
VKLKPNPKARLVLESNSQAGQESFVLNMHDFKQQGTYLEIGSGFPIQDSNTYILESKYGWKGVGIDLLEERITQHQKQRKNPCIQTNAVFTDYNKLLLRYEMPKQIDYLQIDVDFNPTTFEHNSLSTLETIVESDYRFSVITFEHDVYFTDSRVNTKGAKEKSKQIFLDNGYQIFGDNIQDSRGLPFEDWYIDPNIFEHNGTFSNLKGIDLFSR